MATLIGLAIRVKLARSLHPTVKVRVSITPGTHNTEEAINRQLADKVRQYKHFFVMCYVNRSVLRQQWKIQI